MKKIKNYWFIVLFGLTLFFPLYGKKLEQNITLSGVTSATEEVELTKKTIGNGDYQTYLNDKWDANFSGKKALLKIRNQFLYSVCRISPNKNVVIGKEGYLYEPKYIYLENQIYAPASEDYFTTLGENLNKLQQLLNESGKELYVFVTPSKAHFCKEYIPDKYSFLSKEGEYAHTEYSKLIEVLEKNDIVYFDSIKYIEESGAKLGLGSPLFYKSGIHWSNSWGYNAANELLNLMREEGKYDLSKIEVTESKSDIPVYPSTDLYNSLNLILPADEQWYSAQMNVIEEGSDHPTIFLRGGSFMGQSLNGLIRCGIFGEDVHFENNYYHMNGYTQSKVLSGFDRYEEMDLDLLLGKSDILILEVNEAVIYKMGWGFIDYLLNHPEYLDYNY